MGMKKDENGKRQVAEKERDAERRDCAWIKRE
jgi:hypothetical protein